MPTWAYCYWTQSPNNINTKLTGHESCWLRTVTDFECRSQSQKAAEMSHRIDVNSVSSLKHSAGGYAPGIQETPCRVALRAHRAMQASTLVLAQTLILTDQLGDCE